MGPRDDLLHPGIPFAVHSTDGVVLTVRVAGASRDAAAFAPADPDLDAYAVLDFDAFDAWFEEDERLLAHPRDPYHRVDIRASSRHVRIERDGRLLAVSARPTLVFETNLPTRFYLPRDDMHAATQSSDHTTACAYKGQASYWSFGDGDAIAWSYPNPLSDASQLTDLVAFYDEVVDVTVDGVTRPRPDSVFARRSGTSSASEPARRDRPPRTVPAARRVSGTRTWTCANPDAARSRDRGQQLAPTERSETDLSTTTRIRR